MFDNILRVHDKNGELIAIFSGDTDGISEEAMSDLLVAPTIRIEQNGISRLTFQMLANSEKWQSIKDPENLYHINNRWYTPMTDSAYQYTDENGVSVVNVMCVETWALLSRLYTQAFNCGIYCYAKARFNRYVNDGAEFIIYSSGCFNPGDTISNANAWAQVKNWERTDSNGNQLTYAILTQDEYKPTNWKDFPSGVFMKSFSVSGNTATMVIESRSKVNMSKAFQYSTAGTYNLGNSPIPSAVSKVVITTTTVTGDYQSGYNYNTSDKEISNYGYNSSTGILNLYYYPSGGETINAVTVTYVQNNFGEISPGATCTFAYGAEVVDEHTFVILPKAKSKYKLTINGVTYEDSQVKDSRGVRMPRGSAGYAMWAALQDSGWTLGVCDVLAKGFDTSIDYGCFNIESDMKDVLYIVQYIQKLYGGILDWDSERYELNYRAENSTHYQAYNDGFNEWKGYAFREGKNITERPLVTYDNTIITRAFLLGYGNLNVRKVNNNKSYVDNFSYTDAIYCGYLKQELIYDTRDEGGQRQLLYWGKRELAKQCKPRKMISLTVTDTRTVEGMEHEVFDINDIVKVYYHDESTDTDTVELQRVVAWEYNAFAMWDCTVELGDKTTNEIELFKLVYNKSMSTPGTNGSGNLPGDSITMGNSYNQNSITNHIQLIARTTTNNSDAMAGLIMDTSSTHAQVDLFAYYKKQVEGMLSESYAGLQFYANEKGSQAVIEANHHSDQITQSLDGTLRQTITDTAAGIKEQATKDYANLQAYARLQVKNLEDGKVKELINSYSELNRTVTRDYALKTDVTGFRKEVFGGDGKPGAITEAKNEAMDYADENFALSSELTSFEKKILGGDGQPGEISKATAGLIKYTDAEQAAINLFADYENKGLIATTANIELFANKYKSYLTLNAIVDNEIGASLSISSKYDRDSGQILGFVTCTANTAINLTDAQTINLSAKGAVYINSSRAFINASSIDIGVDQDRPSSINIGLSHQNTLNIRGQVCRKMYADIQTLLNNNQKIYYFGWYSSEDYNSEPAK